MVKNFLGLLLLVLSIVVIAKIAFLPHPVAVIQHQSAHSIAVASVPIIHPPQVDSNQLFNSITALNYRRYTQLERERARRYLIHALKQFGWSPTLQPFEGGINILATRQGTAPQAKTVLVAAHYDTVVVSPGADDNNTGVAVVLELARLFGSRSTSNTLQLVLFDQEEQGLRGSAAFVNQSPHLELLQGVIVMDMLGFACYRPGCQHYPTGLPVTPPTDKGDFLAVVGDTEHLSLLNTFHAASQLGLPQVLTLPVPFKGLLTPDTLRSDHAPFWYKGIGAVLVTDTANLRSPHYHQSSDRPSTLDHRFFPGAAQIVVNATTILLE